MARRVLALAALGAFSVSCVTARYGRPEGAEAAAFASAAGDECRAVASEGRYAFLFGAIPISAEPPAFSPKQGASYRIVERADWLDYAVTVLGGWAVTLTRMTVEVQECAEDVLVVGRTQREAEERAALDALTRAHPGETALILRDGETLVGRVAEIDAETIVLEVREGMNRNGDSGEQESQVPDESKESDEDESDGSQSDENESQDGAGGDAPGREDAPAAEDARIGDRILLKNGTQIEGIVIGQTRESITIRTDSGTRRLNKSDVERLQLGVALAAKTRTREVRVERSKIARIVLRQN